MLPKAELSSIFLIILIAFGAYTECCETYQMRYGCRIYNGHCNCGYGCMSEYRYDTHEECRLVLKGKKVDICVEKKPCQNGGTCLQVLTGDKYKCLCQGTGYYGKSCEKMCPKGNAVHKSEPMAYECVVI